MPESSKTKSQHSTNHTLVMLSGGIDSTAALWLVLNKPNELAVAPIRRKLYTSASPKRSES